MTILGGIIAEIPGRISAAVLGRIMVAIIGGTVVEIPGMIIAAILKRIFARYWVGFSRDTE